MIATPYLLYTGGMDDPLAAKTARGVAFWQADTVMGQYRGHAGGIDLGLEDVELAEAVARGARTLVVGIATAGGFIPPVVVDDIVAALRAGLDIASGLHQRLGSVRAIADTAVAFGRRLWDVREPPADLRVATGARRAGWRLLTVGTDCAVGKMYTTLALERALRARGVTATFRATGQTGILIAGAGIPVDAVVADFISGAVERLSPARDDDGWDLIEGQGSLFHPSFAGVSLGLLHGAQPDALVLCHEAGRTRVRHAIEHAIPDLRLCLERNLEAARLTNPDVVAVGVSLNTSALTPEASARARAEVEQALVLPCEDPVASGVGTIVDRLLSTLA